MSLVHVGKNRSVLGLLILAASLCSHIVWPVFARADPGVMLATAMSSNMVLSVTARSAESSPGKVQGIDPKLPFDQLLRRHYGTVDGFPSNWINDVLQCRRGYLWIATDNGLVRYSGLNIEVFDRTNVPELPSQEIRVLLEDSQGAIWIGTNSGIARYDPGQPGSFVAFSDAQGIPVYALCEDKTGSIWIGTRKATWVLRGGVLEQVDEAPNHVRAIALDSQGRLWFGADSGLYQKTQSGFTELTHARLPAENTSELGVSHTRVNVIVNDGGNGVWVGTNRTLLHWVDGQFTGQGAEIEPQQIYDVRVLENGSIYLAARFGVFRSSDGNRFEVVDPTVSALCLLEDDENRLWVGHGDNRGMNRFQPNPATAWWAISPVRCVHRDRQGSVWFGSNEGLHRFENGEVVDFRLGDDPRWRVQTLIERESAPLLVGTTRGFMEFDGMKLRKTDLPPETEQMNIAAGLEDSNRRLWFSLASGIAFCQARDELYSIALPEGRAHWFWESEKGDVWVGHEAGVYVVPADAQAKNSAIRNPRSMGEEALERMGRPRVLCHCIASGGGLWIGTANGIVRYLDGAFTCFLPEDGIVADNVERIAEDDSGHLWYAGRDGLYYAALDDLKQLKDLGPATGEQTPPVGKRVSGFERFPPLRCFSQGCLVNDSELWMVAERGLVRLPIGRTATDTSRGRVFVEQVELDGVSLDFAQQVRYYSGPSRLQFRFAAPDFKSPNRTQLRYRLDPQDKDWIDASHERTVQYTGLPYGEYVFRVALARDGRPDTETESRVALVVVPQWWERPTVRALLGLLILGGLLFGTWAYTHNVRMRNDALQREISVRKRAEIARDEAEATARTYHRELARMERVASLGEMATSIAHEVNQPLFAIVSNAQTANKLLLRDDPDMDEIHEALRDIEDDGNRAAHIIDNVRTRVRKGKRSIGKVDLNSCVDDVLRFFSHEAERRKVSIDVQLADNLMPVEGDATELQQVILNLILNAAQAMKNCTESSRRIAIETDCQSELVRLVVCDRGHGLDETALQRIFEPLYTTKAEGTGMGLAINKTIVEAHGGRIWAENRTDGGARFVMQLPVARKA